MKFVYVLALSALSSGALASAVNVELQRNEDGSIDPTTRFANEWSDHLYSEVHFRKTSTNEIDGASSLTRSSMSLENQYLRLDLLGYRNTSKSLAMTAGIENIMLQRDEFGFGEVSGNNLSIDNQVEIQANKLLFTGSYNLDHEYLTFSAGVEFSPWGTLSVDQDTSISYTSDFETQSSGTDTLDPSWGANLSVLFKTKWDVAFGFAAEYETLALKYDIDQVNSTVDGFEAGRVEQDQETLRTSFRLVLPSFRDEGRPLLGLTNEEITIKQNGEDTSETTLYVVVGFQQGF